MVDVNKVNELVRELDKELSKHGLTFDEYLLYKTLHVYEHRNHETMQSLEQKGFVKDGKITNHDHINEIDMTMKNFFNFNDDPSKTQDNSEILKLLVFMHLGNPVGRPF